MNCVLVFLWDFLPISFNLYSVLQFSPSTPTPGDPHLLLPFSLAAILRALSFSIALTYYIVIPFLFFPLCHGIIEGSNCSLFFLNPLFFSRVPGTALGSVNAWRREWKGSLSVSERDRQTERKSCLIKSIKENHRKSLTFSFKQFVWEITHMPCNSLLRVIYAMMNY